MLRATCCAGVNATLDISLSQSHTSYTVLGLNLCIHKMPLRRWWVMTIENLIFLNAFNWCLQTSGLTPKVCSSVILVVFHLIFLQYFFWLKTVWWIRSISNATLLITWISFLRASAMLKHVIDIVWTSVRPSVCPSHAGTLSKRLNILSCFFHHTIAHSF